MSVVGPAGIGKSRLAHELAGGLDATVVTGGCASYGEGVTYRPLAEIVAGLGGRDRVAALLGEGTEAGKVLAAAGLSEGQAEAEETFWAVRRLLEAAAGERPLVVVFEDLHWAEPTLLDLIDYLAGFSADGPLLLVCVTRPDLLDARPAWAAPQPGRSLLVLDPLPEADALRLVTAAGAPDPGAAERIVRTAEGNPLFLEQLVAVGAGPGELPSTIHAVLAARLGRLEPGERALLEHAAVQGRTFHATEALVPGLTAARLMALVQRQLIRPARSELPGQDAFRFAHALIREAAYRSLPRQRRAELHEAAARWLDAQPGVHDETAGHHLAAAHDARAALGRADAGLARAAAARLAAAAEAALLRGDPSAGARLMERAAGLRADGELAPALGAALFEAGLLDDATRVLDEAIATAPRPALRARALVERELVRLETDPGTAGLVPDAEWDALDGDVPGECRVALLRGQLAFNAGRAAEAEQAWVRAARCADAAGLRRDAVRGRRLAGHRRRARAAAGRRGDPRTSRRSARSCARARSRPPRRSTRSRTCTPCAETSRRRRRCSPRRARSCASSAGSARGSPTWRRSRGCSPGSPSGPRRCCAGTSRCCRRCAWAPRWPPRPRCSRAPCSPRAAPPRRASSPPRPAAARRRWDSLTQALWRGARARALALDGHADEALALAREAVAVLEPTDLLSDRGDAMLDLAAVLSTCGRREDAERAARAAVALYERKGNAVAAARAQSFLHHGQGGR